MDLSPVVVAFARTRCWYFGCSFAPVGELTATRHVTVSLTAGHTVRRDVSHVVPLCAIHHDQVAVDAITHPWIDDVQWQRRTDWPRHGATA